MIRLAESAKCRSCSSRLAAARWRARQGGGGGSGGGEGQKVGNLLLGPAGPNTQAKNHQQKHNQEHNKSTSKSTIRSTKKEHQQKHHQEHKKTRKLKKHLLRVEAKVETEAEGFPFEIYLRVWRLQATRGQAQKKTKPLLCYCARNPEARHPRATHPKQQTVTMLLYQEPGGQAQKTIQNSYEM